MSNRTLRITIGIVLVMTMSLAIILPTTSYAFFPRYYPIIRTAPIGGGGSSGSIGNSGGSYSGYHGPIYQPQATVTTYSNGAVTQSTPYGTVGHGGVHVPVTSTTSQSTPSGQSTSTPTVITITKTYTQYIYDTYEVNHYIYYYMYPIIKWVFTLVNIGQYQQPGYHSVGNQLMFLPGYGSGGIFVPVFATEAIYTFNIAPSTKPQITGWYTGSTSQSSSGPYLVSQSSTPPQLTGVQQAVNNAGQAVNNIQQSATTNPNGLASTTYVYFSNTLPGKNNIQYIIKQPTPYYYSPQDIAVAYLTGNLYETQAVSDLLHGNIIGAAQSFGTALYNYGKGVYEQAWNFYAGVVSTLFNTVTSPNNPWNVAHALSIGNIIGAVGTVFSNVGQALSNGWNQAMGWFSHL